MNLDQLTVAAAALFGLLIGSFLNVVIYRLPRRESLLYPSSHCPVCDTEIKARHNVPVLGWLVLRGRCASCHEPISARYPLVEFTTGLLFALIALRLGPQPELPAYLFLAAAGITLAMIDVDRQSAPAQLVPVCLVVSALLLLPAAAGNTELGITAVHAAAGVAALPLAYAVVAIGSHRAVDVAVLRFSALLGFFMGWLSLEALAVAAVLTVAVGLSARLASPAHARLATAMPIALVVNCAAALALLVPLPLAFS